MICDYPRLIQEKTTLNTLILFALLDIAIICIHEGLTIVFGRLLDLGTSNNAMKIIKFE